MTTYIKLEDVRFIIENWHDIYQGNETDKLSDAIYKKINSLPSIDFDEMIKEMIDESKTQWAGLAYDSGTLEALLNKLPK